MSTPRARKAITRTVGVTLVVAGVGGLAIGVALASPGSGLTPETLVKADLQESVRLNSDRVKLQTKDPTDVRVQRITFAAGSYSGWHHHPGTVVVAVESGTVTHTDSSCRSTTYGPGLPAGAVFVEGGDQPAQASSTSGAVVYATYVTPDDQPPRVEDAVPACAR
jgi:quercetin dioxygenase-like cupin family protein